MRVHHVLVVLAATSLFLIVAGTASAKKPSPTPPDAALVVAVESGATDPAPLDGSLAATPPAGAEVETEVLAGAPADVSVDQLAETEALLASGCWWAQVWRSGKNLFGSTLWKYFQRIEWCSNGSYITSKTRIRWGETYFPGWSFKGHIGSTTGGGVGYTYYRARTQGHFCLISYFSCVQDAYPWIDMTVYRNGTYSWSTGG
jgi:hypothetical protein